MIINLYYVAKSDLILIDIELVSVGLLESLESAIVSLLQQLFQIIAGIFPCFFNFCKILYCIYSLFSDNIIPVIRVVEHSLAHEIHFSLIILKDLVNSDHR